MQYEIRDNPKFGSLEITFPGKPSDDVLKCLKERGFRWNFKEKLWYGYDKEREITDALNAITAGAKEPEAVAVGGVVGAGYLGGGEWTGCNYSNRRYMSAKEINAIVKAELKRLYPSIKFSARSESYSGGQSSYLTIYLTTEQLFASKEVCKDEFFSHSFSSWYTIHDGDRTRDIFGTDMTDEQRQDAFEIFYARMLAAYQEDAHNIERYLSDFAKEVLKTAKALYHSFIHDETNSMVDYFDRNLYDDYYFCNLDNADRRKSWEH